jgi:hypothetical protein
VFIDWERVRVFIRPEATDLRKQINGLADITQTDMEQDLGLTRGRCMCQAETMDDSELKLLLLDNID